MAIVVTTAAAVVAQIKVQQVQAAAPVAKAMQQALNKGDDMMTLLKKFSFIPGFGGGTPAPPPPPAAPAPVAKKTDVAVQKARADEIKRSKLAAGAGGTNKTKNLLASDEATTTKNTLLGGS